MRLPTIQYLRWTRSRNVDLERDFPLLYSGMLPPEPHQIELPDAAALLGFDAADRPALAERMAEDLGLPPASGWIQPGTHWTLFQLVTAAQELRPGPIVVEEPAYEPLRRIAEAMGGEILRLPRPRSLNFGLEPGALQALEAAQPSLLILSQPHNPSGATLGDDTLTRLADFSARTGCRVLSDEVYGAFAPEKSLAGRMERLAVVSSFTKVMGLPGFRCSFASAPEDWLREAHRISDFGPIAVSGPSQAMARNAWEKRESLWERARARAAGNREHMAAWIRQNEGHLDAFLPTAGIICFARLRARTHEAATALAAHKGVAGPFGFGLDDSPGGSHEWIEALRREHRVHLVPGAFFEDPRAFRLGYGCDGERLREGLDRLSGFLREAMEEA